MPVRIFPSFLIILFTLLVCLHAEAQLKDPVSGLFDRKNMPEQPVREYFGGFVVQANWNDLQPCEGCGLAGDNVIDKAIVNVRTLPNAGHLRIKVRIYSGRYAPDWVKAINGGPVVVSDPTDQVLNVKVPRWWTDEYQQAYASFVRLLAEKYDTVPEIVDFTISGCMTVYAEPMIRGLASRENRVNLLKAGYNIPDEMEAQRRTIDAHQAFKHTCSSMAMNPMQLILPDTSALFTTDSTIALMNYADKSLCGKFVAGNNSILYPISRRGDKYAVMYDALEKRGPAIYFQTATPVKIGDLAQTLEWAIEKKAGAVELPGNYPYHSMNDTLSDDQLRDFNARLRAQPRSDLIPAFALFDTGVVNGCTDSTYVFEPSLNHDTYHFRWEFDNGDPAFLPEEKASTEYSLPGLYNVTLIVENECNTDTLIANKILHVTDCNNTSLTPVHQPDHLSMMQSGAAIYLNPSVGIEKVEVYSIRGKLLACFDHYGNPLELNGIDPGIYLFRVFTGRDVLTAKFFIR